MAGEPGTTRLARLLGTSLPLIQAPMAGVQGHALAAAVCNAGGLGSLPAAMLSPSALAAELAALVAATSRPYNVNFFCHAPAAADPVREAAWRTLLAPYYAEWGVPAASGSGAGREPFGEAAAAVIEAFRPRVVSFHFGLPAPALLARVKASGAVVLGSATTVAEARWLETHGADAVIAQGLEAGGHRGLFLGSDLGGQLATHDLLRALAGVVGVPLIAAGGIGDAAGVAAARALGAAGVQVGTAYLGCPEATLGALHRAALAAGGETALTHLYTGRPARGLVTRLMRELGPMRPEVPAFPRAADALAPLRVAAERAGRTDFSPLWCGQGGVRGPSRPAAALTRALAAGFV